MLGLLLAIICAINIGYQILAAIACLSFIRRRPEPAPQRRPRVSILKPLRGPDPFYPLALRSHFEIDYPDFELLLGVRDPGDPAVDIVRSLCQEYPHVNARLFICPTDAPNRKVGVLLDLAPHATGELWVVNDGDITVTPDYLDRIVQPLEDPHIGVVTCLYRARWSSWASRFEALGVTTDFSPSTLIAPMVHIAEFALGSTLCFRRADLDALGGFACIADYLADDYQLGKQMVKLGRRNWMSTLVVETGLEGNWHDVWRHQVRWARTIRLSRGDAYPGLPVTHAGFFALLAMLGGAWPLGALSLFFRLLMALCAIVATRAWYQLPDLCLVPFRDCFAFAVWVAGLGGSRVMWRGLELPVDRQGRIGNLPPSL